MRDRKESAGAFDDSLLSDDELLRYSRHIMLDQFDLAGQERLKQAHVVVVGCGGLGMAALPLFAGAGIGKITLVDYDRSILPIFTGRPVIVWGS
ncbi:ThiF family adenylyltransferase [Ignatzschineria indica]|uniref:ThiF family adenylyltransferase n=1 Tax=Ignatzschineria indica TaxID=472583 RepID=UPI00362817A0